MPEGTVTALYAPNATPEQQRAAAAAVSRQPNALAPPAIRGIIVDATDLVHDDSSWRRRLLRLVHQLGIGARYTQFYRSWDGDYLTDVLCGRREFGEALESFLRGAGLSWAQIDEVEAATRSERQAVQANPRLLPCLEKTMAELSALDLLLLAWADAPQPAHRLRQQLECMGLARRFCSVLSSCDVEAAQPSRECYRASLRALGLNANEALYVGDNPLHLAAARSFGLATAAFNLQPSTIADVFLARFEDLPRYVRGRTGAARGTA